jgi:hypothetical protein
VRHRSILELDTEIFGEVLEFARSEVGAVVGDNAVRDTVPVDNGLEELDRLGCLLVGDRNSLYSLGELVHCDQWVSMTSSGRFGERPHLIETLLCKGPGHRDGV